MNPTMRVGYYLSVVGGSAALWAYGGETRWGALLVTTVLVAVVDVGVWAYRRNRRSA